MYHYVNNLVNPANGNALPGYLVYALDEASQIVPIYSDKNGTPIQNVSGYDNAAISDDDGNFNFYIADGTYGVQFRSVDGAVLKTILNISMLSGSANFFDNLAGLKSANIDLAQVVYDNAPFIWQMGDFTGEDDEINVVASNNVPLTSGAWVRQNAAKIATTDGTVQADLDARPTSIALAAPTGSALVGFRQDGVGAATRTALAEFRDTVKPQQFQAFVDGIGDDAPAFQRANDYLATLGGGAILVPKGTYKLSSLVTLHPRVSIIGAGVDRTVINCLGSGFISTDSTSDRGITVFRDFQMVGSGRTTGTAIAVAMNTSLSRIQGVRFRDILIHGFNIGIHGRTMWHSMIDGCRIMNVTYGVWLEGQCVSPRITGSQIVSEGSSYGDGSIGIYADQYLYSDSIPRRPEAVLVDGETLVYGFDTNVFLNRALTASVVNCDIDAAIQTAIRCNTVDYKCVIRNNYVAVLYDSRGVTGIRLGALAAPNTSLVSISENSISGAGVYDANSTGIRIDGSNRAGEISVANNNIGLGGGLGTALYLNTAQNVDVVKNTLTGVEFSINKENFGGHRFDRNTINGPIRRVGINTAGGTPPNPDIFTNNLGTTVTGYNGPITIPSGQTTVTLSTASLGMPANPSAAPASLLLTPVATQLSSGSPADRGAIRAYYAVSGGVGSVTITVQNSISSDSNDVNLEVIAR